MSAYDDDGGGCDERCTTMAAGVMIAVGVMMGINEYDGIECKCDDAGSKMAAG